MISQMMSRFAFLSPARQKHQLTALLRCFLILVSGCLLALQVQAEMCATPLPAPTPEMLANVQRQARNHGFLWRITKGGHSSYLYGTMHVGKLEWSFPGPALVQALQASTSIALELNMHDPHLMQDLQTGIGAATAPALDAEVNKRLQQRLEAQARLNCVPMDGLRAVRPEIQISALTLQAARLHGLESSYSAESVLASYADSRKLPIESLETVQEQLNSFLARDSAEMEYLLDSGLTDLENGDALKLIGQLADVWANSDFQQLDSYGKWCNCLKNETDRAAMQRLLDDRNPTLAVRLDMLHETGQRVFAAVGALHMIGRAGLPVRMRALGYQVQRIF